MRVPIDFPLAARYLFKAMKPAIPRSVAARLDYLLKFLHYRRHIRVVTRSQRGAESRLMIAIVHLNAPDFLLLSLHAARALHRDAAIVVIDNGSTPRVLDHVKRLCQRYECTVLHNESTYRDHVLAIQLAIELANALNKDYLAILDNDTVLKSSLYTVVDAMNRCGAVLAGPHDVMPYSRGYLRYAPLAVHASLMILRPREVMEAGGRFCSFNYVIDRFSQTPEPYHSLAYACLGRVLYLKPRVIENLFPLTVYTLNDHVIGYHAWYSSRIRLSALRDVDRLQVDYILEQHRKIKRFLVSEVSYLSP